MILFKVSLLILILLLTLPRCHQSHQQSSNSSQQASNSLDFASQELKSNLILNNATLEQSNSQGQAPKTPEPATLLGLGLIGSLLLKTGSSRNKQK
jgi:hypothetical protein